MISKSSCLSVCLAGLLLFSANLATNAERLAEDQHELSNRFNQFEEAALRIADSIESEEPERATQIRNAIQRAQVMSIADRFDSLVDILEFGNLSTAKQDQQVLTEQLEELYQLVLADPRESQLEKERKAWERLEKEIRRLIRSERSLRSRIERESTEQSSQEQSNIEREASELQASEPLSQEGANESPSQDSRESKKTDEQQAEAKQGTIPEPSNSAERVDENLDKAREAMQQAQENLDKQNTDEAKRDQLKAIHELESAQREAEERLRQLREEERQRMLAGLAERLRKMKLSEEMLHASTRKLHDTSQGKSERYLAMETNKLASRQKLIATSAGRALKLVEEEGQSLVFAEALRQALADMQRVEQRLLDGRTSRLTQDLEEGIIESLEEMLNAVEETLEQMQQQQQGKPSEGSQEDKSLVNQIAELRLLRSTQARIKRQTSFWEVAVEEGEATHKEMLAELKELAIQQNRLARAARHTAKKSQ